MTLYSDGPPGQRGVLGDQITVNFTIKENDDPYGVVGFKAPNIIKTIGKYLSEYNLHTLTYVHKSEPNDLPKKASFPSPSSLNQRPLDKVPLPLLTITITQQQLLCWP